MRLIGRIGDKLARRVFVVKLAQKLPNRAAADAPAMAMLPPLEPCSIYVHEARLAEAPPRGALSTKQELHNQQMARFTARWESDPFSMELHLQRAVARSPWRVTRAGDADLIYVAANLSLTCAQYKTFLAGRLWDQIETTLWRKNESAADGTAAASTPKAVSLQYLGHCTFHYRSSVLRHYNPPADTILLVDKMASTPRAGLVVAPFAITQPTWLTEGRASTPHPTLWANRPLLFFGGHVPKLYVSTLRYKLWRQLRNEPRVTTQSLSLPCSVGSYSICTLPDLRAPRGTPPGQPADFYATFCHAACNASRKDSSHAHATHQLLQRTAYYAHGQFKSHQASCAGSWRMTAQQAADEVRRICVPYRSLVDYASELPDMQRDRARSGSRADFLAAAARHRFCLIAQGDPGNTAKIGETVALGAAGGCIPLFVLREPDVRRRRSSLAPRPHDFLRDYPYASTWLDYCTIAYFVTDHAARTNMSRVLAWLDSRPAAEVDDKRRALRAVRPAFVLRPDASATRPSAAEFALSEACHKARAIPRRSRIPRDAPTLPEPLHVAGGAHARCTLW